MLLSILYLTSVVCLGFVSGSTFYSSLVEIPVRRGATAEQQLQNWLAVFPVASGLLKTFGVATLPLLITTGVVSENWLWHVAAGMMAALMPFTSLLIAPVNDKLAAVDPADASEDTCEQIRAWDRLHHGRTCLACAAFSLASAAPTIPGFRVSW